MMDILLLLWMILINMKYIINNNGNRITTESAFEAIKILVEAIGDIESGNDWRSNNEEIEIII